MVSSSDGEVIETNGFNGIKYTLIIPEDALLYDKEITLTPVISMIGLSLSSGMLGAIQIDPDGLQLLKPATLIIDFPFVIPSYLAGFSFNKNGEGFQLLPIERNNTQVIFEITPFSTQGTGAITQAEIDALKLQGQYLTGMDLFQNKVSIIALEMEYYYGPNWRDDPNRVDEWMALGKNAETNPVTRLDDALSALGHL